jgi:hypothetical protein
MRLSQILFFALFCVAQSDCNANCTRDCTRKQADIEKTAHCHYVIKNFKPKTSTSCPVPPNVYQDLYKNYNVTTIEQQYNEYKPCMEWVSGLIFENMICILIIIWLICFIKHPWP